MKYYLNLNPQQSHNEHELHKENCSHLPNKNYLSYIGDFSSEIDALNAAIIKYPYFLIDGCYYCCNSVHRF